MISFETYQKIQELYEIGLSKARIAKKLGITERTVNRYRQSHCRRAQRPHQRRVSKRQGCVYRGFTDR